MKEYFFPEVSGSSTQTDEIVILPSSGLGSEEVASKEIAIQVPELSMENSSEVAPDRELSGSSVDEAEEETSSHVSNSSIINASNVTNAVKRSGIPLSHAIADTALGHVLTNSILGPTVFAVFNQFAPAVSSGIVSFFADTLKMDATAPFFLPLLINVIPLSFAAIECAVKFRLGTLTDKDTKVHTPFAQIMPFERIMALFTIALLTVFQWNNAVIADFPDAEGRKADNAFKDFFATSVAAFWGQLLVATLLYKLASSAVSYVGSFYAKSKNGADSSQLRQSETSPLLEDQQTLSNYCRDDGMNINKTDVVFQA